MHLDAVIEQLREDAGASKLQREKLRIAEACKADLLALREEVFATRRAEMIERGQIDYPLDMSLDDVVKRHVLRVYEAYPSIESTCEVLKLSPATLYRRLNDWGVRKKKEPFACASS